MANTSLTARVASLETRASETDAVLETLTIKVSDVRVGNAKILKNLGALMPAQGAPMIELTDDETDALFE